MKELICCAMAVVINFPGPAFSQSQDPGSKISASIMINQLADSKYKFGLGLEAVYNLSKKVSFVFNYFNSSSTVIERNFQRNKTDNYFLFAPRLTLGNDQYVNLFAEMGPVLTYPTGKGEGTTEKYTQGPSGIEVETYYYVNQINSKVRLGLSIGAGTEVKLSPVFSAMVKADQLLLSHPGYLLSLSAGLKCNF